MIVIDFAGTLIRPEIIEEANEFRARVLKRALPGKDEHLHSDKLYKMNNSSVKALTGISEEMNILYRQNDMSLIDLSGEDMQNHISTNLFQIGMFMVAKKHGSAVFADGLIEELKRIKKLGYQIAIVSGVRTDIISGMLEICGVDLFDGIYGQPPILGVSNEDNYRGLDIEFIIGDKESDLKHPNAKTILVSWGHGKDCDADYKIDKAEELRKIIKSRI